MEYKRYQVFLSSTFSDLQPIRNACWQNLIDLNYIVAGMETFPASSDDPFTYIQPIISQSDYFVLIIGSRYGTVPDGEEISFTEKEFDFAVEQKIPILAFIAKDEIRNNPKVDIDHEKLSKLDRFISRASSGRMVHFWGR